MTISRTRLAALIAIAVGLVVFTAANAHLLVIAFQSQPDCVEHARIGHTEPGQYSAARSAC